jgi:two-component system, chemotaxis family, response regulator PixH
MNEPMTEIVPVQPRILLVEDLAIHRRVIPVRLGTLGREVVARPNTVEAEYYLTESRPDLILLDVILPGKDGFTFCRERKADPKTSGISIMILSDLKGDAFERSLEAGADDHLSKQIDDVVLRIRTRLHLNIQEQRRRSGRLGAGGSGVSILMVTPNPTLKAQLEAQATQDGHRLRIVKSLEELDQLNSADQVLIIDTARDFTGLPEALVSVRTNPETSDLAVLVLCEKIEFPLLQSIETMVDDVLWKPLKAQATRFRLKHLAELAKLMQVRSPADRHHPTE